VAASNDMSEYEVIAEIRGEEGVAARITKRTTNHKAVRFSYSFFREYPKDGKTKETYWFSPRHLTAVANLIPAVEQRLRKETGR
jgi:hypothetical protein